MKQVLLVRHGEVEGSERGMLLGRTDLSLSKVGRRQCVSLRACLPSGPGVAFLSSPLARARQSAAIVAEGRDIAIEIEPDLCEIDFGEWEGLSFDRIRREYPEQVQRWSRFAADFAFPGGESIKEFRARVRRVGSRIAASSADQVVAFTHGGVIRALICHFLGLDLGRYLLFEVDPAGVATLHLWEHRGVLAGLSRAPRDEARGRA